MKNNTITQVKELPKCDFCNKKAIVDGKTIMGPWANMCKEHFDLYGVGLGLGKGQKLEVEDEKI